jgi:hypothetical protein
MKRLLRVLLGLVLLLLVLGGAAILFVDTLAERAIERGGTYALGVDTGLQEANIGLFSGDFELAGLAVANPPGFEAREFLALRSGRLQLPLGNLLESRVVVPALELEGVTLDLERNANGTNYGVILDHLERFESGAEPGGQEEPEPAGETVYQVERLVVRDVRASVQLFATGGDLTKLDLAVPEVVIEDLGSDMTLAELCGVVVKVLLRAAMQAGEGVIPEELLADLRGRMAELETLAGERVQAGLDELEDELRERAKGLGPEAERAVEQLGDEVQGKLDELLQGRKKDD